MTIPFRLATFNCENLFRRPRIFETSEKKSQQLLAKVAQLEAELRRPVFDHDLIKQLEKELADYITIIDIREKHTTAEGAGQWLGWIEFKKEPINGGAIHNTAHVIFDLDADVICLMEIEDRLGLQRFHDSELVAQFLAPKQRTGYEHVLLIDGNDERGIDVAVMSRRPVQWLRSHIHERTNYTNQAGQTTRVPQFSRDCLEVHVGLPNGQELHLLVNHLKSQLFSVNDPLSTIRRRGQAERVAQIASTHNLKTQLLAVVGDLNSANGDHSLDALLTHPDLHNVVLDRPVGDRWTYAGSKKEQIDYILASTALNKLARTVSIERRGLFSKGCAAKGTCYPEVTTSKLSASDHAGVVVEWALPN